MIGIMVIWLISLGMALMYQVNCFPQPLSYNKKPVSGRLPVVVFVFRRTLYMNMDMTGKGTEFRPFQKALPEEEMTHRYTFRHIH